jgi:hypothetical protein
VRGGKKKRRRSSSGSDTDGDSVAGAGGAMKVWEIDAGGTRKPYLCMDIPNAAQMAAALKGRGPVVFAPTIRGKDNSFWPAIVIDEPFRRKGACVHVRVHARVCVRAFRGSTCIHTF